jgi:hypothetical protein
MILLLGILLQTPTPTVGDTIWLERTVEVPPGSQVRAARWEPEGEIGLLGRPVIRRTGNLVTVAYPAVAWTAGTHTVLVPGPVLIRQDGVTDSLPAEAHSIQVVSVLPAGQPPERIVVQPEVGVVNERVTSPWPVVLGLLIAGALFAPFAWWWRRRGAPLGAPRATPIPAGVPIGEWAEAGESRAVAAAVARGLRAALAAGVRGLPPGLVTSRLIRVVNEQRPSWPSEEIAQLLQALDAAQYAESPTTELTSLAQRATAIQRRLEGAA